MKLQGKVALVTGGGRGIGRGIVLALAQEGADIAVVETDTLDSPNNQYGTKEINGFASAKEAAQEVKNLGRRAIAIKADVSKPDQIEAMFKQATAELGQIDILVNNAGVVHVANVEEYPVDAWDLTMDVNIRAMFLCCKAVIPKMKAQGGGKIINVASIAGKNGFPSLACYSASKFAAVGFTNALAKELARDNITVNAICPGIIWTQMWKLLADLWKLPGESVEQSWKRNLDTIIPQGRDQTPADMGALAVYFATSDNVTGQAANVDGGAEMH